MADLQTIRAILAGARAAGRATLLEPEGLAVLAAAGIAVPAWRLVRDEAEVDDVLLGSLPGERVVVKVVAAAVLHKTEVGGVAIVPRTPDAVRDAMAAMRARLPSPPDGFTVSAFVPHDAGPGGELLLTLRWTDDMGAVVVGLVERVE